MFAATVAALLMGFPVAFTLAGSALIFAGLGAAVGSFDWAFLSALPERMYGVMTNGTLVAVPLFVFMGVMLERSKISEDLLDSMARLFASVKSGLGLSVCLVGGVLAASTGIVGATVVTMGLISLPAMLKRGYSPSLASGIVCASGTLGQIIPPSIVLVILGDIISSAYQQAQLAMGNYSPRSISVGDLFIGALLPGGLLMLMYMVYVGLRGWLDPSAVQATDDGTVDETAAPPLLPTLVRSLLPPLLLMTGVLGSILAGAATPTEAASVGAIGAMALARLRGQLSLPTLRAVMRETT
jgi:tripartite ATP-independent transporter DctM subunit